ncbi:phage tail family protein [Pediococcus inopinatus]|uniref:phage tail domain-containing protein n=1 Tax=Pediococcus inopinatus TaxID=114090 RepID=UPI002B25E13B|nr:phage tail domain-containing protein [Pediococcus inopinatus]WPC19418.1 phage tail family protein [Pediococcus inopinatus]
MNKYEFEYCGINSRTDLHLVMGHVALPIAPTISESTVSIPNKYGNEYYGTSWESKVISIPCTMPAVDYATYVQTLQNLSNVLINLDDDPGTEYPLTFGFNPDVTYYGHFTQIPTPDFMSETVTDVQFSLEFTMSDPRGFLPKQTIALDGSLDNKITPAGNAPTEPIISIIPKRAIYYCGYVLNGGQVAIGTDSADELADPTPKYETLVSDPMNTLANWSTDSTVISSITDNGTIKAQGTLASTDGAIVIKNKDNQGHRDWGTYIANSWRGPMARYTKGPTETLENWYTEGYFHHQKFTGTHNGRAMARAAYLVLNSDGQTIARMEIEDNYEGGGRSPILYIQITRPGGNFSGSNYHSLYDGHGAKQFYVAGNGKNQKVKLPYKKTVTVKTKKKGKNGKTTVVSQKKTITAYKTVDNANNRDVFSDFYGKVWLEKNGDDWSWGVTRYNLKTHLPYKDKKYAYSASGKWHDSKGTYSGLKLGGMAILGMEHPISEDAMNPVIKYHEPYLSFSNLIIKKVNTVEEAKPQPIADTNDEIIINTEDQQVTVNGEVAGFQASTDWPKLNGGRVNEMMFAGDIVDADIQLQLTPKIK